MIQKTFIIRSPEVINSVSEFLKAIPDEPLIEVVIRNHRKDRTAAQNRLLWTWVTLIAEEIGLTKEETHECLKKRLLVPIFERDDVNYAEMINSIRNLYTKGFKQDALSMHKQIARMTSTTSASVKQFAEYLTDIEKDSANKGIILPRPEDLYYDSLMVKK